MNPVKLEEHDFGTLEYHSRFVIGTIKPDFFVTNEVAKRLLNATKLHFGKNKFVYISNREFGHNVDVSVYKHVDPKRMVGIALVSSDREQLVSSAGPEQASYSGSFGVFNTLESAMSWARSFVDREEQCDN